MKFKFKDLVVALPQDPIPVRPCGIISPCAGGVHTLCAVPSPCGILSPCSGGHHTLCAYPSPCGILSPCGHISVNPCGTLPSLGCGPSVIFEDPAGQVEQLATLKEQLKEQLKQVEQAEVALGESMQPQNLEQLDDLEKRLTSALSELKARRESLQKKK